MATYVVKDSSGSAFNVDEDKLPDAEKDGFLPVVSNGKEEHRVSMSDFSKAAADGFKPKLHVSKIESGLRGAAQGATLGFADELAGGAEALWDSLKPNEKASFMQLYARRRDESRDNFKNAEAANPKTYMGGEVAGMIGTSFIPGLNAASGAKLGAVAGKAALQGALAGAGHTESDIRSQDGLKDIVMGTVAGAAGGAVGHGIGKAVQGGISKFASRADDVADKLDSLAEIQSAKALGADKATIRRLGDDKVRAIGRDALDDRIISPLASTDEMLARSQGVRKLGGEQMNAVYKQIDDAGASTFSPWEVADDVNSKLGDFWRSPLNKGEAGQLDNMIEAISMRGVGKDGRSLVNDIPLQEAQLLKEEIAKVAYPNGRKVNPDLITPKQQMAQDAYRIIKDSIDKAADDAAVLMEKPGLKEALAEGKANYGAGKGAESLLGNRVAREQGNKLFGLTDTIVGAGGIATALPTGGMSLLGSAALVGGKKLAEKYGPQTTAVAADKLAKIVRNSPEVLGKYAAVLENAARRGSQALTATYYMLSKDHPEFNQLMSRIESQGE